MLEVSDSETESISSLDKINEWLENMDNVGKGLGNSMNETPLPLYDELLRKQQLTNPVSLQSCVTSQQHFISQSSGVRFVGYPQTGANTPRALVNHQPVFNQYPSAESNLPSMPLYTVASQQPIMSTAYSTTNYPYHAASHVAPASRNVGLPSMVNQTSPIFDPHQYSQQQCSDVLQLNSSHLAARQTVRDLPKFGGDPEDWPRFISAYERTTRMCAFRNDELLDRLERSLHDKALNAVKSLLLHPDNVPVIINRRLWRRSAESVCNDSSLPNG